MSLPITVTFSLVNLLQAAAKVQELCKGLKKLRLQTGIYGIHNPQALSGARAKRGRHSLGPSGSIFRRPLCFEV